MGPPPEDYVGLGDRTLRYPYEAKVDGLESGKTYYFVLRAKNAVGQSDQNTKSTAFYDAVITEGDKTALQAAILDAGRKVQVNYTTASWTAMQTALTASNAVYANTAATTAEIANATTELTKAIAALIEKSAEDMVKPIITLNGTSDLTVRAGSTYTDAGASASDNIDGDISSYIVVSNLVDTTTAGDYIVCYNVTDSSGNVADEVTRIVHVLAVNAQLVAKPVIQIGVDPEYKNSLGIFIGLENFEDSNGNTIDNHNVAEYQIEVAYDPAKVTILDVVDEFKLGQFSKNVDSVAGKVYVADTAAIGKTNYNKLFFLPIKLTGSALDTTSLHVNYIEIRDTSLNQIGVEKPTDFVFHRGKIINEEPGTQPNITDAIAGLQYLAGLKNVGTDLGQVNPINMASIVGPDTGTTIIRPNVKDIITLMQYLVQFRDTFFKLISN